jgi:hypothetical protein
VQALDATQALQVRRVSSSADLLHPGEYVFIEKRPPQITIEKKPLANPGFFRRMFHRDYELKQIVELVWPDYDVAILNCPECNTPLATTARRKIISVEPLTLELPLTGLYCKTKSFAIENGRLIRVVYHASLPADSVLPS